jgi:hypothetical protein
MSLRKRVFLLFVMLGLFASSGFAVTILCVEDPVSGCVAPIPGTGILVASDGEQHPFDPFHTGYDTSDGINLTAYKGMYTVDPNGVWINPLADIWVLPESAPFQKTLTVYFSKNLLVEDVFKILDSNQQGSDSIDLEEIQGKTVLTFVSDTEIPEPGTLLMMGTGLIGVVGVVRRRLM